MFFDQNSQDQRPMTRRQMDSFLRQCEHELFGQSSPSRLPVGRLPGAEQYPAKLLNGRVRLEVAA